MLTVVIPDVLEDLMTHNYARLEVSVERYREKPDWKFEVVIPATSSRGTIGAAALVGYEEVKHARVPEVVVESYLRGLAYKVRGFFNDPTKHVPRQKFEAWAKRTGLQYTHNPDGTVTIHAMDADRTLRPGDWVAYEGEGRFLMIDQLTYARSTWATNIDSIQIPTADAW